MAIWVTLVVLVCRQCHCWGQEACWSIAPVQSLLKRMRPSWHGPWIHSVSCCSLLTRWWTMMYSRQPCISWAYFESKKWTEYSSLQLASPVTTTGTCMSHRITSGRDSGKSGPKDQVALHYCYTSPSHWCTTHGPLLPLGRDDIPAFTPAGMQGWVDLVGCRLCLSI